MYFEFLSSLNIGLSEIDLSCDEVGMLFNLKYLPTIAPKRPSLWPEARIFILELDFQLGYIILSATLLGILIAIVLEVIFFSAKRKNKNEWN